MSTPREIDRWPKPTSQRGIKLVVVSCSRTGTMGLYEALKILGYRPYHMAELLFTGDNLSHMKFLEEAVIAHNNRFSGLKKYGREEFDKWLADYDVFLELGSYLGTDAIEAYLTDPDIKFILTERDPDSWVRSFNQFIAVDIIGRLSSPLMFFIKRFDSWLSLFINLNEIMYAVYANSIPYKAPGNKEALRQNYVNYIKLVKKTIPPERLCVIKLEDGLGWKQICPYLEKPIPDVPYPKGTGHAGILAAYLDPIVQKAAIRMVATVATPVIAVGAWFLLRQGHAPWLGSVFGG